MVSSVGSKRFNLLGSSWSSKAGMSSLGCVSSFCRYLVLKLVISDLGVDGRIILGWVSRKWDVCMWTGLGWTRTETGGGLL